MGYDVSSRGYLKRAKALLQNNSQASLFYAAFELRAGIEARLQQYAEAWKQIPELAKKHWEADRQWKALARAFKIGDKYVRLALRDAGTGTLLKVYYYTPVTETLKTDAGRLGNYSHAMKTSKPETDPFWEKMKGELSQVAERLYMANRGTLLGPAMMRETMAVTVSIEFPNQEEEHHKEILAVGGKMSVEVSYPDCLPDPLEEEAHCWVKE